MTILAGSTLDPAIAMLAISRAVVLDHREITAVLVTSAAFLCTVCGLGWLAA